MAERYIYITVILLVFFTFDVFSVITDLGVNSSKNMTKQIVFNLNRSVIISLYK
jgi:hypothetical protein